MKCPTGGAAEMVHDTRDVPFTYEGESIMIPDVAGDFCPACEEAIFDMNQWRRIDGLLSEFRKQVNATAVDPGFIKGVREKLGLDQREAAGIFGSSVNAFSRYEMGEARPPQALVKLFRVLEHRPELLTEIKAI